MKHLISAIVFSLLVVGEVLAGNLNTAQVVKLANAKSISTVSSIANSNGYKLAYKHNGARGWEGYDMTDMAWSYNASYVASSNGWSYSGSFSAIKLLYNNSQNSSESIVYVVSDGKYFNQIKTQISSYGYTFYKEDTNIFPNSIAYCFFNDSLGIYAIFQESFGNGGYQIHFYHE